VRWRGAALVVSDAMDVGSGMGGGGTGIVERRGAVARMRGRRGGKAWELKTLFLVVRTTLAGDKADTTLLRLARSYRC
jgi:hypothetical protein